MAMSFAIEHPDRLVRLLQLSAPEGDIPDLASMMMLIVIT
jgi:hypothetical protein